MTGTTKCIRCGTEKAVGKVHTQSPTNYFSRDFNVCMPDIVNLERWLENKPNAKAYIPFLVFLPPDTTEEMIARIILTTREPPEQFQARTGREVSG